MAYHLRELRSRLLKSVLAVIAGGILAAFFYHDLLRLLTAPYEQGIQALQQSGKPIEAKLTFTGVSEAFTFELKTSVVAGIVIASPVWLWQIWAFIVPALHKNERKWSVLFAAAAGPLFLVGTLVGYYVLPKGIQILVGFTPADVSNLTNLGGYLNFVLRILLVFAVAFEIPLFVVLLNLAGVVKGRQLAGARPWIVIGVFIFAAIATPTTDPITMLFLAVPMTLLFGLSEVIARLVDRRRAKKDSLSGYDDDEVSPIDVDNDPSDDRPGPLDEE